MSNPAFALLCCLFLSQNTFAAINAAIDASRVRGVAPLAVFFDATGTTSTDTTKPFHELHYQWDFGDPNAGTWQYGNPNNNDKNKTYGPVAAHVFETPGVYTVSLTTKDLHGDTAYESVKITVQDPNTVFSGNNTVCFSTSGNFSGCPSGARHIKTSSSSDIKGYIAPGRRLLMRRGERWTGSNIRIYSDGPGIIGAFGTGNKPVFDNIGFDVAAGVPPVLGKPGTRDWRVMDIEFINTQARVFSSEGEFENLLLLRLEAHDTAQQFILFAGSKLNYYNANRGQQHELHNGVFVVDSNMVDAASFAVGNRYAVLGNSWDGGGTTHTNRNGYIGKGIISHNYYTKPGNSTLHLIKLHAPDWDGNALFSPATETREVVISDNHFHGTIENWSVALGPQSGRSYANEHVVDVIVERNLFTAEKGSPVTQLHTAGYNITVRNNIFNLTGGGSGARAASASARNSGQPPVFGFWFHNNNIYRSDNSGIEGVSSSASDTEIHNNIIYSPAGNSTLGCSNGSSGCLNNLVNIDPLWTEPSNEDFSLQPGSPAINSGIIIPVFDDYISNFRLPGGSIDIGAYESDAVPPSQPPATVPTVAITASPVSITAGYSSTLSWNTTDADTCTAYDGWRGSIDTSGSQSVSPTTTTTYTLTCDGVGGSATTSATVSVTPQQTDTTTPSTPANLASSITTHNSTALSWDASSDNVGVASYHVYKDGILETTTTDTLATVNGLSPSTTYSFTVSTQDAAGNTSNRSSPVSITTLPDPIDGEVDGYFSNWNASNGYAIGSGLDIALTLTGDTSNVKDVIFQVWSHTHGVEAAYLDANLPYIYPHTELDKVAPGSGKYVQALIRDSGNNIIHTVSSKTTFMVSSSTAGFLETIIIHNVDSQWTPVTLTKSYSSLVAVCSYEYVNNNIPAVVRMRNVTSTGFQVRLQNPSDVVPDAETVFCLAMEEGAWRLADGRTIEAHKYTSSTTDHRHDWTGEAQTYQSSYTHPVVLGQVMSFNDPRWSVFWARGDSIANPPSPTNIYTGMHVGEDSDTTRIDEQVGFIVVEGGIGSVDGVPYEAALGSDIVVGVNANDKSYSFDQFFSSQPAVGIVSQSAMDGNNGSWAVLNGPGALSPLSITIAVDEDMIKDSERAHTREQVAYMVFATNIVTALIP